jgi:putative transposase
MARQSLRQTEFLGEHFRKVSPSFGGSLLRSNPKTQRPLSTKDPIHLILRSSVGGMRRPKNYGAIHKQLYKSAKKYGIKIYSYSNVGNHLHLLIKLSKRSFWAPFIREVTSRIAFIAQKVSDRSVHKSHSRLSLDKSADKKIKFWKYRPFTRIIGGWKKAFLTVKNYIYLNKLEARGLISRSQIKTLKELRQFVLDGS